MQHPQWQLQQAKAQFSEVVRLAKVEPQEIMLRGKPEVVLISRELFNELTQKPSFLELMRSSPLCGVDLDLDRDSSKTREVKL